MNNTQFRRLVLDQPSSSSSDKQGGKRGNGGDGSSRGSGTPLLGSRMKSNIPMTPRSVTGVDFARQLAEQRREASGQPPTKRFKSSAAPKGTKYAAGYQDRTLARRQQEGEDEDGTGDVDDRARRVQALEEMVKLGQIDMATFEKLRADIGVGGNVGSTHLVKGLDWKLLQKVKAGEDITKEESEPEPTAAKEDEVNVDDEFERVLEEREDAVRPVEKQEKAKKSTMAPPPAPAQKKTRDQILKELKASRLAGAQQKQEPPASTLSTKFKKIGDGKGEKKRWIEKDEKGRRREVLLTTDAEGKTKRKVRWIDKPGDKNGDTRGGQLLMPDKEAKPLGMEVPADISAKALAAEPEEEDDDIFAGVGTEYNPLADIGDEDDSSSSSESEGEVKDKSTKPSKASGKADEAQRNEADTKDTVDAAPSQPTKPRNYFASTSTETTTEEPPKNPFSSDPNILAALKRAANIRQSSPSADAGDGDADSNEETDADALRRRRKFLEEARKRDMQDAMDMDIGFGGSRFGDEDDDESVPLEDEKGSNKRKRGPKKRKGDKDSAGDVMRVLEGRKKDGEKGKGK
ncbi:hypothetical protein FQN54_007833 [Arachnomyces sp. PD_36]|nr:hypothetical protein FQN54_007833 [Arachnomyces sp. PD_36]